MDVGPPRVVIYVLNDELEPKATEIADFLKKDCENISYFTVSSKPQYSIGPAIGYARTLTRYFTMHMRYYNFNGCLDNNVVDVKYLRDLVDDLTSNSTESEVMSYEVVIFLGHSNVLNIGPFSTCNILQATLRHHPVILTFLGCCGGSVRYGPTLMISQMRGLNTIFTFYQRRIYEDELLQTSAIIGIRNYLRFSRMEILREMGLTARTIAKHSFICAALGVPITLDDPTIFANDSDDESTVQSFMRMLEKKFNNISWPLSCLQLALFHIHTFEVATSSRPSICTFIDQMEKFQSNAAEIEKQCKYEIEKRHLDKLIEMVAEMHLLHVLPETITYLKEGKWKDVDHLQFFVAILHGYWGKNTYINIRACACFHLAEMKRDVDSNTQPLQKYQLCAIGFCLFCENTNVAFELPMEVLPYGLVLGGSNLEPNQPFYLENLPDEADLLWISRFDACETDHKYIQLYEGNSTSIMISNYYEREIKKMTECYNYTKADIDNALNALQHYIIYGNCTDGYNVKEFDNKTCRDTGRMQCFESFRAGVKYAEMWVTPWNETPVIIRRCRFVYEYFKCHDEKCAGILYFTDSHYGWDLIPEQKVEQRLTTVAAEKLKNLDFYQKLSGLSKKDLYDLQNNINEGFPFCKIGRLNIRKTQYKLLAI